MMPQGERPLKRKRLGDALLERRSISPADLEKTIQDQPKANMRLGELLLKRGLVPKADLVAALEDVRGFAYVDCRTAVVDPEALKLIRREAAAGYGVMPLAVEGEFLVTVMAEPQDLHVISELEFVSGKRIAPRFGFRWEIDEAIKKWYGGPVADEHPAAGGGDVPVLDQIDVSNTHFSSSSSSERGRAAVAEFEAELRKERTPAVRMVSAVLTAAVLKRASDVHIEPQPAATVVRLRVDGTLRELVQFPAALGVPLVSRIKILADLDIAERRAPQDGRFQVAIGEQKMDLRVSTLPTRDGEKVVMRLLDPSATKVPLIDLGFSDRDAATLGRLLRRPQGMVLVTGPTGSGKSTTLYAALNLVRSPTMNVVTIEDPIEYRIPEINQVQINIPAGLTFAGTLRSVLRQDPNIIMLGEIRDTETAEIALQASQTGHLVLSTLHTNDSVAAVTRLLDLQVPGFLMAASISGILAQRLVRKLCSCRNEAAAGPEYRAQLAAVGIDDPPDTRFLSVGCAACDNTGYKGRVGIYEVLVFDEGIATAVRSGTRDDEIRNLARRGGMRLMAEDALEKVRQGITTLDEVLRVVPFEHGDGARCRNCKQALASNFLFCPYCGGKVLSPGASPPPHPPATSHGGVRQ